MKRRTLLQSILPAALFPNVLLAEAHEEKGGAMPTPTTVYELRVYTAASGRLPELLARFRDHTMKLFEKHGMKNIAYWTPTDEPGKSGTLIYILQHASREAAAANWKSFQDDPDWKSVKEKSEANGKLVDKIDSTFLALTEFSPQIG